jgi:hypothetical protein
MNRQLAFVTSGCLHGIVLLALIELPRMPSQSLRQIPQRSESVVVEIVDLNHLRDRRFDFDIEKIESHIGRLFPFTDAISVSGSIQSENGRGQLGVFAMESRLVNPMPALALPESEMQAVLDAAWSRRERWSAFRQIQEMVQRFDPQEGDLPALLRRYVSENLLQPFEPSHNSEPKLWALLSVAADHSDFVQFISGVVERVPASRATTELLFLLDKLVQANLHAVLCLYELDPSDGLRWTVSMNRSGAEALRRVRRHHEGVLSVRGMWDVSVLSRHYHQVRVGILKQVLTNTPEEYRANDARFLIGEIYWRQGRTHDALEIWRKIDSDANDEFFVVSSQIRQATRAEKLISQKIDAALNDQTRRWTEASLQRLHDFGFHADTF